MVKNKIKNKNWIVIQCQEFIDFSPNCFTPVIPVYCITRNRSQPSNPPGTTHCNPLKHVGSEIRQMDLLVVRIKFLRGRLRSHLQLQAVVLPATQLLVSANFAASVFLDNVFSMFPQRLTFEVQRFQRLWSPNALYLSLQRWPSKVLHSLRCAGYLTNGVSWGGCCPAARSQLDQNMWSFTFNGSKHFNPNTNW